MSSFEGVLDGKILRLRMLLLCLIYLSALNLDIQVGTIYFGAGMERFNVFNGLVF
jgi:hypothetical protein